MTFVTANEVRNLGGAAAPGRPAERSSPAVALASPRVLVGAPAGRAVPTTARGPGNNDSSPRPKARRFSTFSFRPPAPPYSPPHQLSSVVPLVVTAEAPLFATDGSLRVPACSHISMVINLIYRC